MEILIELPGAIGRFLWMIHRDVELWAQAAPEQRSKLFKAGTLHVPEGVPVRVASNASALLAITSEAEPGNGALACRSIAAWAAEMAPSTALLFAWAAAAIAPESATFARDVAIHARRAGETALAESWLRRAIALSRRHAEWAPYGLAFTDLGEVLAERGDYDRARSAFRRALRACRRHALQRELRSRAVLGLFRVALAVRANEESDRLRDRLLRLYPIHHPRALRLRIEIAQALAALGHHSAVIEVLSSPAARRGPEEDRATAAQLLETAQAAAGEASPDKSST